MTGERRLRSDLRAIVDAALDAVDPEHRVAEALDRRLLDLPEPSAPGGNLYLVAVGKAAPAMVRGVLPRVADRIREGVVLVPEGSDDGGPFPPALRTLRGGHPLPTQESVDGARAALGLAERAGAGDTLLVLLSGGGSALLTAPVRGVTLDDVRAVTGMLLESGSAIEELNAVRKHLDRVKGGRLARAAAPAAVRAAVLSDVVGDRLDVIASGPVSPDPTRFADGLDVLRRRNLLSSAPAGVRDHLEAGSAGDRDETPGLADPCFRAVRASVVANVGTAISGARAEAEARGYRVRVLGTDVRGEAREVGSDLGRLVRRVREGSEGPEPPACVLAGGETTVTVVGSGRGGRNQELALGAAREVAGLSDVLLASVGTDGVDGPTDAAGAVVTGRTLDRASRGGLSAERALARNDAYAFFRALGDLLVTGPTGTNVMDVQVALVGDQPERGRFERSGGGAP